MQQIKHIYKWIITGRQSLPWLYALICALICAVNYAHFMRNGNQALEQKRLGNTAMDISELKWGHNLESPPPF